MIQQPPPAYRMLRGTELSADGEFTICHLVCNHPPMSLMPHELDGYWQRFDMIWCSHCAQELRDNAQAVIRTGSAQ